MSHHPTPIASSRRVLALDFIRLYRHEHGCSPSLDEIAATLKTTRQRAHAIVQALAAQGSIVQHRGKRRGIDLPRFLDNIATTDLELELQGRRREQAGLSVLPIAAIYAPALDEGMTKTELTLLAKLDDVP